MLRRVQDNVVQMKRSMSALTIDMDRRYGDFYNMTVVSLSILRLTMMWRAFLLLNLLASSRPYGPLLARSGYLEKHVQGVRLMGWVLY